MLITSLMSLALVAPPAAPAAAEQTHAVPRLVCESESLRAGTTANLGLTFRIEPHWHLYWNGQNDTGGTIRFTLTSPDGFVTEAAQWPAPSRQVLPGDTLNHIYEEEITLVIPVKVPPASAGTTARFTASLNWIACEEACVAEKASVELSLPVVAADAPAGPSVDSPLFDRARRRLPKPLPLGSPGVELSLNASTGIARVPNASRLTLYPGPECSPIPFLLTEGDVKGEVLRVTLDSPEGVPARFQGILEVRAQGATSSTYYQVDVSGDKPGFNRK